MGPSRPAGGHGAARRRSRDRIVEPISREERLGAWLTRLRDPARRTWVVASGAAIVGFVCAGPARDEDRDSGRTAEVQAIYLEPAHLGQGLGRRLLERALDDLRARGWTDVELWALEGNARAERFYERAGFTRGERAPIVVAGVPLPHRRWGPPLG